MARPPVIATATTETRPAPGTPVGRTLTLSCGPPGWTSCRGEPEGRPRQLHRLVWPAPHATLPLQGFIQPREELPDCPEVIRRVSGRGESGGSAQVVPMRAGGDDLSPFFGFVAETVA